MLDPVQTSTDSVPGQHIFGDFGDPARPFWVPASWTWSGFSWGPPVNIPSFDWDRWRDEFDRDVDNWITEPDPYNPFLPPEPLPKTRPPVVRPKIRPPRVQPVPPPWRWREPEWPWTARETIESPYMWPRRVDPPWSPLPDYPYSPPTGVAEPRPFEWTRPTTDFTVEPLPELQPFWWEDPWQWIAPIPAIQLEPQPVIEPYPQPYPPSTQPELWPITMPEPTPTRRPWEVPFPLPLLPPVPRTPVDIPTPPVHVPTPYAPVPPPEVFPWPQPDEVVDLAKSHPIPLPEEGGPVELSPPETMEPDDRRPDRPVEVSLGGRRGTMNMRDYWLLWQLLGGVGWHD